MAANFVKIYASILDSSVWSADLATRIVWISLLAMADQYGHVEAAVPGIARRANVSIEECEGALAVLTSPDQYSKSPEHDGRRIEKDAGGWRILNYQRYRELQTDKQVSDADRQRRKRERDMSQVSRDVTAESQPVALEGEGEGEAKGDSTSPPAREALQNDTPNVPPVHVGKTAGERTLALKLPTDADRLALTAICARVPSAASWVAEAEAALVGMHGVTLTPQQLGETLRDYAANGALEAPSLQHFRRYLRRGAEPYTAPSLRPRVGAAPPEAQRAVDAIRALITVNGSSRFIPRAQVKAMGRAVESAYDHVGGPDRFLSQPADKLVFLVRDFADALQSASGKLDGAPRNVAGVGL